METSAFLYENLSYSMLIWLHFGTSMLISYSLFLYVLPIVYNIVVLYLPSFKFGFKDPKLEMAGAGSGVPTIPKSLIKNINDSKVFAAIFARNPKLFDNVQPQDVKTFFTGLDDKLNNIVNDLKTLPTSEDEPEKSEDTLGTTEKQTITELKSDSEISSAGSTESPDGISEVDSAQDIGNDDAEKKAQKSGKKRWLIYGNLVFFVAILGVNIYGYFYYSSMLSEFFEIKKSPYKYSIENYELNYPKLKTVKDKNKVELIKNVNTYVEIINYVKADKTRREKMEAEKKEGKK